MKVHVTEKASASKIRKTLKIGVRSRKAAKDAIRRTRKAR